jgi:hypothetical protein
LEKQRREIMRNARRVRRKEACLVENHHAGGFTRVLVTEGAGLGFVDVHKISSSINRRRRFLLGLHNAQN